ncbi:MAG: endonuclease/exonuclease/phosphatase family protein [Planctomycetota bacterium]|nr:endonuclease/exonuclease/phosphatase family protein [Planctomycetota bacterium]
MKPWRTDAVPVGAFTADAPGALDLDAGLTLLSWNVHKGRHARLDAELGRLCEGHRPDLVALQESRENIALPSGYAGHEGTSFRRGALGTREGVMTLSRVAPRAVHRVRSSERELFLATPKAALITLYATLDGSMLCLLNVHGLNFDPSGGQLRRQLDDLARAVDQLDGPLLVAGDLNAWNAAREEAVRELAGRLGLGEVRVDFPGGTKGRAPGEKVAKALGIDSKLHLDRVYARGLRARTAHWGEDCDASDHVPLIVHLARH